jgi:uncharacterized membrane protein YphA (DoxX/SURF4 family)
MKETNTNQLHKIFINEQYTAYWLKSYKPYIFNNERVFTMSAQNLTCSVCHSTSESILGSKLSHQLDRIDIYLTNWLAAHSINLLRISLGIIFFWFGVLKFFPGLSPAQDLATRTIEILSFGLISPQLSILILATWECSIGLGLISGLFKRGTIFLLLAQMMGTITPVFFFPTEVFTTLPYAPTLEGQYIIKNLVLISAALVIGATVRGGMVVADPHHYLVADTKQTQPE